MSKTKQSSDYIDFNSETQFKIESEANNFRDKIFKDYKIRIYITIPSINFNKPGIASMHDFWHIITEIIQQDNPELYQYTDFKKKTRGREWMIYTHSFAFLVNKRLNFGPSEIARFMHKTHASIINSINKTENAIWTNDNHFLSVHHKLHEKLKEYVGIISENTKV
jgi:hypothetical protein